MRLRPTVLFFVIHSLLIYSVHAQPAAIDRNKVMDLLQNQQFEEVITYLSPVLAQDSDNLQVLGLVGYACYMKDDNSAAEQYYQRIFGIDSNNIGAMQYLAILSSRQYPEKAQFFTLRLISLQPGKAVHYRNMADLFRKLNKKDSAFTYYSHAYELAPNDPRNAAGLAEILIEKKNYPEADSILDRVLAGDSLNISCLKLRVRSAYETKFYQDALIPGERLVRLGELSLSALTQLVLSYYNLKMYMDCIRICEYMETSGLSVEAIYYYESRACARLKDYTRSNELLNTCLTAAISKTAGWYYNDLGQNYEELKQYRAAIAQYDTAYYLFKDPLMKYNCGRIYESNLHNARLAQKYYTQYLALAKPQSAEEKQAYEYVRRRWGKKAQGK